MMIDQIFAEISDPEPQTLTSWRLCWKGHRLVQILSSGKYFYQIFGAIHQIVDDISQSG